jgi:hypothetical protein
MLWPVILPFQITCAVLLVVVVAFTAFATPKTWSRVTAFILYTGIAFLAFIPSCTGIMLAVDAVRFGDFHYATYDDIPDFRSKRYLPQAATDIQMNKHASGFRARYTIRADVFAAYLDDLWRTHEEHSPVQRGGISDEGNPVNLESFNHRFGDLGWKCPSNAVVHHSPGEGDGGGATYYVDADAGLVFQITGFW